MTKVNAHTSSTVHTLTSFLFKTRAHRCIQRNLRNMKIHYCIYTFESQENILSQCKFDIHVLSIYFHISSNEHSGSTQYTYTLASYVTSGRTRITFPWIMLSCSWGWRLAVTKISSNIDGALRKKFFLLAAGRSFNDQCSPLLWQINGKVCLCPRHEGTEEEEQR